MNRSRIAVLASGGGSNLQALLDFFSRLGSARAGDIVLVASDRPGAGALSRAKASGIAAALVQSRHAADGVSLGALLDTHAVDLIVLAGYLQLVPADVTRRFAQRVVNVHPAPLPRFGGPGMYGARVHRAVLAAGVAMSGPTVHFVDDVYDHGATIAHWPVPVMSGDDEHRLAARVLRAEHLLMPRIVQLLAAGELATDAAGERSTSLFGRAHALAPFNPELDDATLSILLDDALAK